MAARNLILLFLKVVRFLDCSVTSGNTYAIIDFVNTPKACTRRFELRNDENIISNISVTDIIFDGYLGKWNYRVIPKVKNLKLFFNHS